MSEGYDFVIDIAKVCGLLAIVFGLDANANNIVKAIKESTPRVEYKLQERNVIGNSDLDKFYDINGVNAYTEIDGIRLDLIYGKIRE